jgi:hypothetical protein
MKREVMKKNSPVVTVLWEIAVLACIFTGCATTVNFQAQRPPVWNTLGLQRLAVMPFRTTDGSALQRHAAALLESESLSRIQAANHFTMVNSSEIERVRATNGKIENYADAIFSGQVISVTVQNSSSQSSYKDKSGATRTRTTYTREVNLSFNIALTRTRDAAEIGSDNRMNLRNSSSSQDSGSLRSAEDLLQDIIQGNMRTISRYVAPYSVTEQRRLEVETSKNKAVRQRVKDAEAMVKAGNYKAAQNAYLRIYQNTGSFPAAYNASLLIEMQGDLQGALALMQRVQNDTGNPKASVEIARLQRAISDAGLLVVYKEDNQSQRDKVIALMVDTLPSHMPNRASVALINNTQNERDLTETVINGIMQGFLAKNITVVDRNSRDLLEIERNYQLSGYVSDTDMVSIGNEAGVNIFILVSVIGSGGNRRLSVRMLDVERNTVVYQSPQTDEMNL